MKKADHKFHRDKQNQIKHNSTESSGSFWYGLPANRPIYIPKRKKKK